MQHDQRQRTDRRVTDQWARRMRALEREFERADRARRPRVERNSVPLAVLSGAVVLLVAVLILVTTGGGGTAESAKQQAPPDAFAATPALGWPVAPRGIALPPATAVGPASAPTVQALLESARDRLVELHTGARALAPGNALAAPIRANGSMTFRSEPAAGNHPARLDVSVNVVWAYALRASYPVAGGGTAVVGVHERAVLQYALTAQVPVHPTPRVLADTALWFDADCGYLAGGQVGLPRAADPGALPGYGNGVSVDQAFALATTTEISGHVCRSGGVSSPRPAAS